MYCIFSTLLRQVSTQEMSVQTLYISSPYFGSAAWEGMAHGGDLIANAAPNCIFISSGDD